MKHAKENAMKTHAQTKGASRPRGSGKSRPAGEQAMSLALYQQIREAVRELNPSSR